MKTIIITLLGINLYLLIDYILDNYYFNGNRKGEFLILNRHFFYEFIQIALLGLVIIIQTYFLTNMPWYSWIIPCLFILTWSLRIFTTFKNRNTPSRVSSTPTYDCFYYVGNYVSN